MQRPAFVLLMCLAACGPLFRKGEDENAPPPERLTLCVENQTVAYGNLVARAGQLRFDVMPGQQECKRVLGYGPALEIRAVTTGGGIAGPRRYSARLPGGVRGCWLWRLTDAPASEIDLGPCPEPRDTPEPAPADTMDADSSAARTGRNARR